MRDDSVGLFWAAKFSFVHAANWLGLSGGSGGVKLIRAVGDVYHYVVAQISER